MYAYEKLLEYCVRLLRVTRALCTPIESYLRIGCAYWELLEYCVRILRVTRVLCTHIESYSSIVCVDCDLLETLALRSRDARYAVCELLEYRVRRIQVTRLSSTPCELLKYRVCRLRITRVSSTPIAGYSRIVYADCELLEYRLLRDWSPDPGTLTGILLNYQCLNYFRSNHYINLALYKYIACITNAGIKIM